MSKGNKKRRQERLIEFAVVQGIVVMAFLVYVSQTLPGGSLKVADYALAYTVIAGVWAISVGVKLILSRGWYVVQVYAPYAETSFIMEIHKEPTLEGFPMKIRRSQILDADGPDRLNLIGKRVWLYLIFGISDNEYGHLSMAKMAFDLREQG